MRAAAALFALGAAGTIARAAVPRSLNQVPVPRPANLARFVKSESAAVQLGKALFWDLQVGSDGRTACATCHFHAGADGRSRNTTAPGANARFDGQLPNEALTAADFPFHAFSDPDDRNSPVARSRDDVVGSQGVVRARFEGVAEGAASERGRIDRDGVYGRSARNVRQVGGRNAPSVINAVFNLANFWDGRAHPFFNGVNSLGLMDRQARIHVRGPTGLEQVDLTADLATNPYALDSASLASQALAPVLDTFEMSYSGRTWRDVGRKLLPLRPLRGQAVHPSDSVLGPLANASGDGLSTTYRALVEAAFRDELWDGVERVDGFAQAEANFALFFGLSLQLYEATLVSDDTPFDRFLRGDAGALTDRQIRGMNLFFSEGTSCAFCHTGPELTAASRTQLLAPGEPGFIELMAVASGDLANYDIGFYNIGVRPTAEDAGRGRRVSVNGQSMPLSFTGQHFEREALPFEPLAQPGCVNDLLGNPPTVCPPPTDVITTQAVLGAFKVPGLRNVELTGPYMHNGGMATLMQVVDFYARGGDFRDANLQQLDPIIDVIQGLRGVEARKQELVDFLVSLTDERVRWERAPFDHPQLFVPEGHELRLDGDPRRVRHLPDRVREIPAVGAAGRDAQGLPPLRPFLSDAADPRSGAEFHFQR